jgi:hypothetical protein
MSHSMQFEAGMLRRTSWTGQNRAVAKLDDLALCPEESSLLQEAAASADGVVAISRPRTGDWPENLKHLRSLERCRLLQRITDWNSGVMRCR